jgi:thioredoxin-related protein
MLFRETVAVYFENHTDHTYTNSVRTSQETHYASITKTNRLMLFRETAAVYCETIRNTQIHCVGRMQRSVRTSQETYYVSATETNRLMLFRETVAVYSENHTEHTDTLYGQNAEFCNIYKFSPYLTGNILRLRYRDQPVNAG